MKIKIILNNNKKVKVFVNDKNILESFKIEKKKFQL